MTPRRVLVVGNFGRRALHRQYYNAEHKLAAGLIRAGHNVLTFSDRDAAREATPFGAQRLGRARMARKLAALAAHYRPHMALFGHCDLLGAADYAAVRAAAPGVRLAAFCVDAAFRDATMRAFAARAASMDAAFSTTAEAAAFAAFGFPPGRLFHMPNPVDPAVETARVWDVASERLAWDGLFLGTGIEQREAQLAALRAALPQGLRWHDGGRHRGADRTGSTGFLDALASAAMSPALPLDDRPGAPIHRLYASDRLAQLLGQGVTAFTPARAGFEALYEDGVVAWATRPELAQAMARLWRDDAARRRVGALGWRLARERTDAALVAGWMLAITLGDTPPPVAWPAAALL